MKDVIVICSIICCTYTVIDVIASIILIKKGYRLTKKG